MPVLAGRLVVFLMSKAVLPIMTSVTRFEILAEIFPRQRRIGGKKNRETAGNS